MRFENRAGLHANLTGLSADDHSQYALLAGRSGGQILNGGTAASENLRLVSTTDATKGNVRVESNLTPHASNTYDLGTTALRWKRLITIEGIEISALQYAFRVTGTTSGMYFDSASPRNIALHIDGTQKHVFYMGSSGDEGAVLHIPRTSDPTNANTNGTMYVKDDGSGNMTLMIRSGGAWIAV